MVTDGARADRLTFYAGPAAAVDSVEFVQESALEKLDVKRMLYAEIDAALPDDVVMANSISGLIMSELQAGFPNAARFVVGHPFNPPHLIPLVERDIASIAKERDTLLLPVLSTLARTRRRTWVRLRPAHGWPHSTIWRQSIAMPIVLSPLSRVGIRQHATLRGPRVARIANRKISLSQNDFDSLEIGGKLLRALKDVGYTKPTPIQFMSIPHLLSGKDLLGVARTGTGKTAAFALPLLQRLDEDASSARSRQPRALILAPTRELALQIHEDLILFGRHTKLVHACIFGGVGQNPQVKALARGVDVGVATPGRLLDLAGQRFLDLSKVSVLVLDEADRLLDMGFIRDVRRIVAQTPGTRQSLLFSATIPEEVASLAREILKNPVSVDVSPKQVTVKKTDQRVVMVNTPDKRYVLEHLLRGIEVSRAIVFTRTKHGADKVARQLLARGIGAEATHANGRCKNSNPVMSGAGSNRYRGPWDRHRRCVPRFQLRAAPRTGELRASHRPNRPRRRRMVTGRFVGAQAADRRGAVDQIFSSGGSSHTATAWAGYGA